MNILVSRVDSESDRGCYRHHHTFYKKNEKIQVYFSYHCYLQLLINLEDENTEELDAILELATNLWLLVLSILHN